MPSKPQTPQPELWLSSASEASTAQALAPSLDGFGNLYRQHVVAIYRYHHARTGCVADAQDLTAETFRAALEGISRYQPTQGRPIAWLMGIARHKLADHFRRAPQTIPLESIEAVIGEQPTPEVEAARAMQLDQIAAALRRINPGRAEAITLHLYVGLSLEETGQALDKSPQAVKKLVQRGLADLRRCLRPKEVA
jgi:RNA polymerase sigma-70 factor (ECF subfamily)